MRRFSVNVLFALLVLALSIECAFAAKTPPKKPTSGTHHETLGTQQLKGEFGKIGDTYTLGKAHPWNICLKSAEYTIDPVNCGNRTVWPTEDEKLLLLHFTVHNPQKGLALMRHDMIGITAIDSNDKNWNKENCLASEEKHQEVAQDFKPAQKMDVYSVVRVPNAGAIPKLMLTSFSDHLVIRYDLRGKVKGLPAPYADPSDSSGATVPSVIPARMGEYYPSGVFALKLESISYTTDPVDNKKPGSGQFMIATMSVKALTDSKPLLRHDMFEFKVLDSDGSDIDYSFVLLKASSDSKIAQELDFGQEVRCRFIFKADKGVTAKSFRIAAKCQGRGKPYLYAIE
jgi:hypothetical protein